MLTFLELNGYRVQAPDADLAGSILSFSTGTTPQQLAPLVRDSPERSSEEPVAVVTSRPVAVSGRRRWSHASPRGRVSRRVA